MEISLEDFSGGSFVPLVMFNRMESKNGISFKVWLQKTLLYDEVWSTAQDWYEKKAFDSSLILFEHFSSVRSEKSGLVEILFHATFPLLMLRIIETGPWRVLVKLTFKLGLKLFNCLCISRSSCRKGNDYLGFGVCLETQHPLFQWTLLTSTLSSSWEKPFICVIHLHFLYKSSPWLYYET